MLFFFPDQMVTREQGTLPELHCVLGNCSMRCPTSCIPAVVSGFWHPVTAFSRLNGE